MTRPELHPREDARQSVVRSAIVWTPIFTAATAFAALFGVIAVDSPSAWVTFAIAALIALLSGVSALGALRDLYAEPMETVGVIERKWRKSDILVFRGHYILCHKRVFRIPRDVYEAMPDVGQGVLLQHYPHTQALTAWARMDTAEAAADERDEPEPAAEQTASPGPSVVDEGRRVSPPPPSPPPPSTAPPVAPRERVEPPRFGRPPDEPSQGERP